MAHVQITFHTSKGNKHYSCKIIFFTWNLALALAFLSALLFLESADFALELEDDDELDLDEPDDLELDEEAELDLDEADELDLLLDSPT